jgi:hydroxyacylglutathione hydrolase
MDAVILHFENKLKMEIKQFEDINLSHYSYAILSKGEIALVDPARDPKPYYEFAKKSNARIVAVIETHPHADFVSSHFEIHHTTGAAIYTSRLAGADYPHESFDDGDALVVGGITLRALNTPGHSPDSISIVAFNENGKEAAVFTGDTLFIGDCGRPDLREKAGAITALRTELAKQMYHSLREKLMSLPDDVKVYPAHGAGSLCGKELSPENSSTIGAEKITNWCLQKMREVDFVEELLSGQPFIPKYFPYDVAINKKGAPPIEESVAEIKNHINNKIDNPEGIIIDTRPQEKFKKQHLNHSINLMRGKKFETWLGSIVSPGEKFVLIAETNEIAKELIDRIAKIGYESQITSVITGDAGNIQTPEFDSGDLRENESAYTIVDIRNHSETNDQEIFEGAIRIPLPELRERVSEIPTNKPIIVHCAGGYRSAAGSSIVESAVNGKTPVYDLGDAIKSFA